MHEAPIACLIANGTISPYLLTLVYRYDSAIVPLTSLLVLRAYGPKSVVSRSCSLSLRCAADTAAITEKSGGTVTTDG